MSYGDRTLFSGATFQLNPGERYGLVGANGSGKTTLLNILSGDLEPTEGRVAVPKDARLGILRQDHFRYEGKRVLDVALMGNRELWEALVERERILAKASESFDADRYAKLEDVVQRHDGYSAEARAATVLEGLGLPSDVHHEPIDRLSGGFKLRVLLAQVLASSPDALFLDEPTNHLDILSIRWLETFLSTFPGPVVVISHDHRFLDTVSTHVLDVDYETVTLYPGNYTAFQKATVEERARREKEIEERQREIAHHEKFVERFRAKASKARQAQSKLKLIEKQAESIEELPVTSRRYPSFRFQQRRPSGKEVLAVKGVRKAFGDNEVLHGVDLEVQRGDRLAVIGPNGIGKSTLLKIIMGELEPDAGEVEWGYETHPGYFPQDHRSRLGSGNRTAEDWLWTFCPDRDRGFVRSHLGRMLFEGDDATKKLSQLSGGEAARLVFSRLGLENPNVLVLDEPTNHLDMESIEALVEGLKAFDGTLILVSHDRWLVERIATRVVEIRADGIRDYPGTYREYLSASGEDHLDQEHAALQAKKAKDGGKKGKKKGATEAKAGTRDAGTKKTGGRGSNRKRQGRSGAGDGGGPRSNGARRKTLQEETRRITARIEEAEARKQEIDETFARPGFYDEASSEDLQALNAERAELEAEIADLMARWEETEAELEALA